MISPDIDRIEFNPKILSGKTLIKGTRISVEFLLELLANAWSYETILQNHPQLNQQDILATIEYAQSMIL